jgi:tRNA(fMet)-specific endonuclease VapC
MICVDSDFIIDFLKGKQEAVKAAEVYGEELVTTEINVFEVFFGVYNKKKMSKGEDISASSFFNSIEVLDFGRGAGKIAARIISGLVRSGKVIEQNDCLVASIMLKNGCDRILTRNTEHFKRIKGIKVESY